MREIVAVAATAPHRGSSVPMIDTINAARRQRGACRPHPHLEQPVHFRGLVPLPLGLLHVQLGLLGNVQGDVLLGGRARRPLRALQPINQSINQSIHPSIKAHRTDAAARGGGHRAPQ